ncbi:MAG: subclass B3 metallo-beta-lactamase [Bryobacteraceae bacterium]
MPKTVLALLFALGSLVFGQATWNTPFPPHKVIGNVYFIGSKELASYLITTPLGHILINSDFEATVPLLRENVGKLGFKFSDIKIILGSHAHGDHMEADALVKEFTGAQVMAMEQDVPALKAMKPGGKEHPMDRVLKDGDKVTLGGTTLTANLTAGHTAGCTSWTFPVVEAGKEYNVLVVCSVGVNANYVLVGDKRNYPNIVNDYRKSFDRVRAMKVDVFLGAHPNFYDMEAKYAKLTPGAPNPFIDPAGVKRYVDQKEKDFNAMLAEQSQIKGK